MLKFATLTTLIYVAVANAENLYGPGPYNVTKLTIDMEQDGTKGTLDIWQPIDNGTYPVLFYMAGFSSPVALYNTILTTISSHGFIVAGVDGPSIENSYEEEANLLQGTIEWMQENFDNELENNASADLENSTVFGGHSAGNHAMVQLLENTCSIAKGLIMMSPVDGTDPFGIVDDFVITPGVKTKFDVPTLHIAAGLDPKKLRPLFPPCAPKNKSNDHFYDNMNGQIFSINALAWGHSDIITPCVQTLCPAHPGTADRCPGAEDYQNFLSATSVAFMKGILRDDKEECSYFDYLLDESTMPIEVETKNTGVDYCPVSGCARVDEMTGKTYAGKTKRHGERRQRNIRH